MTPSELLKKYNVPGPRYTSYPTVPYWEGKPAEADWLSCLARELDAHPDGAALYLHIPFCAKLCTFCGCNMRVAKNKAVNAPYLETLHKEWQLYRDRLERRFRFREVHLGGGTPTFLSPDELKILMEPFFAHAEINDDAELSIEIDPRVTSRAHFAALKDLGFTRVSMGIQDFDLKVQQIINRVQPYDKVERVLTEARELGFANINFDLIYGLPFQTKDSIKSTFEQVLTLKPSRIAYYGYAHVPWIKPEHRKFTEADLPDGEEKRALYELGREMLASAGYQEIGMDHFALESDALWQASESGALHRNFMGYMTRHVSPLLGLGVSAISDSWSMFIQNEKLLETYRERVDAGELPITRGHTLTDEDMVIRGHILNLMTRFATDWAGDVDATPFLGQVSGRLEEFVTDGLVSLGHDALKIEREGRPFIRNIAMAFDARLAAKKPDTNLFSKTI